MRVYPVLDLQGGVVVHAVRGERAAYRPLESVLVESVEPARVAAAFRDRLGLDALYVADLDALGGGALQVESLRAVVDEAAHVIIDAGARRAGDIERIFALGAARVIVPLETLATWGVLGEMVRAGAGRDLIFSLDLRDGVPLGGPPGTQAANAGELARRVLGEGIRSLIVLELTSVGSDSGPVHLDLIARLRDAHGDVEIIAGGGVRDVRDLRDLRRAGADGVLVATAFHRARVSARDVRGPL